MIMTAAALSGQNPAPTREEIRTALAGNLCRCGTQQRILAAVLSAFTPKGELDHDDPR
jgi:aerobic-type carbon monoxide dehydrogenase small subunit (CoxS/CutS family)